MLYFCCCSSSRPLFSFLLFYHSHYWNRVLVPVWELNSTLPQIAFLVIPFNPGSPKLNGDSLNTGVYLNPGLGTGLSSLDSLLSIGFWCRQLRISHLRVGGSIPSQFLSWAYSLNCPPHALSPNARECLSMDIPKDQNWQSFRFWGNKTRTQLLYNPTLVNIDDSNSGPGTRPCARCFPQLYKLISLKHPGC